MDIAFPEEAQWANSEIEECTLTLDCRKQLCRLCANAIDVATYIFSKTGKTLSLANKINMCLPVTVNTTDDLPKQLCSSCVEKVNVCYEFSTLCLKAEEQLISKTEEYYNSQNLNSFVNDKGKDMCRNSEGSYYCPLCVQGNMVVCDLNNEDLSKKQIYFGSKYVEVVNVTDMESTVNYEFCNTRNKSDGAVSDEIGVFNKTDFCNTNNKSNSDEIGVFDKTDFCNTHNKSNSDEIGVFDKTESVENISINPPYVTDKSQFIMDSTIITPKHSTIEDCSASDSKYITDRNQFSSQGNFQIKVETIFICRICGDLLQTVDMSYHHTLSHIEEDYYPCILCDSNFTSESQLENHFKDHTFEHKNSQKVKQNSRVSAQCFECSDCSQVFFTKKRFTFHRQLHERHGHGYQCEPCREEFKDETQLYHHVCSVHDNEKLFFCDQCGKSFITRNRLAIHKHEHSGDYPFRCLHCGREFSSKISMLEHTKYHGVAKVLQCFHCDASFTRRTRLTKHIQFEHSKSPAVEPQECYKCSECWAAFPNASQVLKHGEGHTDFYMESTTVFSVFRCEYCEVCFSCREDWKRHIIKHNGDSPYVCLECDIFFKTYYSVMEHKKWHAKPTDLNCNIIFSVPIFFLCEFCGKHFKHWKYLYIHRQTHISMKKETDVRCTNAVEKKYIFEDQSNLCETCGMSFYSPNELSKHRRQDHPRLNEYKCEECGKVLANLAGLIIHRRLHTGEKPFICDVCGKAFRQSSGMYTHRRTHTKECPYRCELCSQAYNVKGDLDNHRRSKHTKERPFKCHVCGKSFLTSGVYYQHKVLHTGIRKYKCTHCEKAFSRWNALRLHTRTHTGEKPHICFVCNRGFAQKGDMKKHMRTQHNITDISSQC